MRKKLDLWSDELKKIDGKKLEYSPLSDAKRNREEKWTKLFGSFYYLIVCSITFIILHIILFSIALKN